MADVVTAPKGAGDGMLCPQCKSETAVIDSRPVLDSIRRRRECVNPDCRHRYTTREIPQENLENYRTLEKRSRREHQIVVAMRNLLAALQEPQEEL